MRGGRQPNRRRGDPTVPGHPSAVQDTRRPVATLRLPTGHRLARPVQLRLPERRTSRVSPGYTMSVPSPLPPDSVGLRYLREVRPLVFPEREPEEERVPELEAELAKQSP